MDIGKIAIGLLSELRENKAHAEGMIEGVSELLKRIREEADRERSSRTDQQDSISGRAEEETKPAQT